ncbi:twin-arginine translocase subunit TatC [Mucilaginibacter rubeus]|uniref:Sec-independent protein translocase protein TatC n=1 Tax=Mucilaginibacter rubeus TaxID=2027860 RepID=A0AAE6JII4_9SPHI|nr:twin-arginine translocase subunit TatC [Mucilaginibacter rubeus]QEM06281.1 twin-arginine translocase subunit TatC [Mucilaginibacter rubeus]QTE44593.1 twin-arginine translocase subunit TatC [Mucilaginibacter rubeus]QTE51191.1 twin-arginine translocase subunit TatC [Mucilaginibacter rubeus]QTE56279.1 twin-arginine translocase subunit TatC [Mucilaginibacter rubeus]QTE64260.1 twin-arginine translocase subunit TatC [Mucilaginibacter rubeus]
MSENKIIKAIKDKGKTLEAEMSFFDHLEALRWHLVRASVAIVIFTAVVFYYYDWIFDTIIMGPSKSTFWTYRMLCKIGAALHRDGFCIDKVNIKLINTEMAGQFTLQINSALIIGITLGVPYLIWEIWRFIKPALHDAERKAATGFVFYACVLFFLGITFGYFVITPMSINFLSSYTVSAAIQNLFDIDSYISSVATLTLATGVVFQLPIIVYILANLGVMTPKFMKETRRYAIVVILVIAAVVTPTPDMLTMTVVSIPLFVLYEVSIVVAGLVEKRKIKKELDFEKGE